MKNSFKYFIIWGAVLFPSLLIANVLLFIFLLGRENFFLILAASIAVSWLIILTLYYVWAIYFYNINRGWTDKDWADHELNVRTEGAEPEPEGNPNSEETLGLPPGTVRGTIALSVIVIGLATMVASFGFPAKFAQNEFLIDHFEFLKTAFLMVIAFYFGGKSLETISRTQILSKEISVKTPLTPTEAPAPVSPSPPTDQVIGDISTETKEPANFNDPSAKG